MRKTLTLAALALCLTTAHAGRKDEPAKHKQPSVVQQIAEALGVQPAWLFWI